MTANHQEKVLHMRKLLASLSSWDRSLGQRLLEAVKQIGLECRHSQWTEAAGRASELAELFEEFIREAPKQEKLLQALQNAFGLSELLLKGRLASQIDPDNLPTDPATWKFVLAGNLAYSTAELIDTLITLGFIIEQVADIERVNQACSSGQVIVLGTVSWFDKNCLSAATRPDPPLLIALADTEDFRTQLKVRRTGVQLLLDLPLDIPRLICALSGLAWMPRVAYRVLLVDDDRSLLQLNTTLLKKAGFEVLALEDPVLTSDSLETFMPECCLFDIEMPVCSGTELAALLRRSKRFNQLPVIYLSAFTDLQHQLDARNAGCEDYLLKPAEPRLLIAAILARVRQFRLYKLMDYQRSQAARQLENLRQALDAHASISFTAPDGSITGVNERFCEMSGYHPDELIGRNHRLIKSGHHPRHTFSEMWQTITEGRVWHGELLNRRKNGSTYWVQNTTVPILDSQGLPEQYISILTNLTEQKAVQAQREQQIRQLELLRQALHEFIITQDIKTTSHLLLNNLLLMTGSSYGFIGEQFYDQDGKAYLRLHAMSDIAWLEKYLPVQSETLKIDELDALFDSSLSSGNILIRNNLTHQPDNFPGSAPLDAFLGVPIYYGSGLIGLAGLLNRPGGYDENSVESLHKIVETFASVVEACRLRGYQQQVIDHLQQARDMEKQAQLAKASLLSNCEQKLRPHLNSLLGQIQILQLNLSLDEEAVIQLREVIAQGQTLAHLIADSMRTLQQEPAYAPSLPGTSHASKKHKRILVAEDSPANQAVLCMQLDVLGYDTDLAGDGAIALAKWKLGGHDLILTDRNMPGMNGLELSRAIRATEQENGTYVPIIAITALNQPEDISCCLQAGMDDVLPKPIELDQLQRALEHWLPRSTPAMSTPNTTADRPIEETLDLDYLTRILGNIDAKQLRELINLFTSTARSDLFACERHLSENNARELGLLMHKLKSAARMVGALRFAAYAEKLEQAAGEARMELARPMHTELVNALSDVEKAAGQLILPGSFNPDTSLDDHIVLPRHVLIVDDDPVARRQLSMLLGRLAIPELESIDNAPQALLLLAQQKDIDLVISDLNMPGMDGIEFLRCLADNGYRQSIILVSGVEEQLLQSAAEVVRSKGMNLLGTLKKPVMRNALLELLVKHHASQLAVQPQNASITITPDEIQEAIRQGEFEVHFQPKVDAATLQVVGVESLARWQRGGKFIPPDIFIKMAEKHQLIAKLSEILMIKAMAGGVLLTQAGFELSVAINVSANWLSDIHLPEFIMASIDNTGFKAENLILEITETGVMADIATAMDILTRLRLKGFKLSIDDFGTGYSSIEQLLRIPFGELKLDRGFVQGAVGKTSARAILASTIEMAHKLKLSTVAEGVETQADLDLVRGLGCDLVQGWLIAKAMPVAQLIDWLHQRPVAAR